MHEDVASIYQAAEGDRLRIGLHRGRERLHEIHAGHLRRLAGRRASPRCCTRRRAATPTTRRRSTASPRRPKPRTCASSPASRSPASRRTPRARSRRSITDRGTIDCDQVIVGAGPWVKQIWDMLDLPTAISIKGRDGKMHDGVPMWTFWSLQEGTLGVDPKLQRTNDGKMPPVIHVDTDAPLYSDVDGSLITDKLWGIYYKPDFNFGGVQGGAMPFKVKTAPETVKIDPYGPESPDFVVGDDFAHMWSRRSPSARSASRARCEVQEGAVRRHRQLHRRQLPGVRPVLRERLRDRRFEPRLQDDRRRQAGRGRHLRQAQRPCLRPVPLLALRRGQAASGVEQPVPVELNGRARASARVPDAGVGEGAGRLSVKLVRQWFRNCRRGPRERRQGAVGPATSRQPKERGERDP